MCLGSNRNGPGKPRSHAGLTRAADAVWQRLFRSAIPVRFIPRRVNHYEFA
jgi:hypothetical protein